MDSARKVFLLALVVLQGPAGGIGDEECGTGTFCEVTKIIGQEASVNCGLCSIERAKRSNPQSSDKHTLNYVQTNNSLGEKILQTDVENENSNATTQKSTLLRKTITASRDNLKNVTLGDHNFDSNKSANSTNFIFDNSTNKDSKVLNLTLSKHVLDELEQSKNAYEKYVNCTNEQSNLNLTHITILKVNLTTSTTINLSKFSNMTSLHLEGKNLTVISICGAKNVSLLTSTFTHLKNVSFLKHFENLRYLNLTNNDLEVIPDHELPSSIVSLDLSKNKINISRALTFSAKLRFINMSQNIIELGENALLSGNVAVLDLSCNRLKTIPRLEMETIEELYLSQNHISSIQRGDLMNMSSLIVLDLRENNLSRVEEKVFDGLTKLQKLDLSKNKISVLTPSSFQFLNNLVTLNIAENPKLGNLQDFEDTSFLFGAGQRLQTIDASRTNLLRIPATLTRSVRQLLLRNNKITSIQCGEMDSFPLLQLMDLSNNIIKEVEEDSLGRLDFLSHLILFGNSLTSIPKSLPNQLLVLDLGSNCIKQLHNVDFLGQQKLRILLLSKNSISSIEDGSFGQLVSLEVLDLSHNPIKYLSRTSFVGPRKLKEMYLVSLTDLIPLQEPLSFPAPESAHLEVLNMESSPVLASQLMDDVAALTMFHELFELNLNHCRLSTLRSDLPKYLPRLHKLELTGNKLNCTNVIWLVRWLQTLNISMQNTGKFRREIYNLRDICREDEDVSEKDNQDGVMCSSPEYLSGRKIISLKEEDFPDLKLTSTAPPPREVTLPTEPYQQQTSTAELELIDSSSTTSSIYNTTDMTSAELSSLESTISITLAVDELLTTTEKSDRKNNNFPKNKTTKNTLNFYNPPTKTSRRVNFANNAYKYSRVEVKTPSPDPIIVLVNDTESDNKDSDNHLNNSVSSEVFLSHDLVEARSSHPGMILFLLVVGVMIVAASFMVYSQCARGWRDRDYIPQQDIEVSSLGGYDLW